MSTDAEISRETQTREPLSREPQTREPLSRERIVAVAVAIADQQGVSSLSMRKLASALGYEAMSLYNHVANKDELLDAMVDHVVAEVTLPPGDAPWRSALHEVSVEMHGALLRHPWAVDLWTRQFPGPHRFGFMEAILGHIDDAGLGETLADVAFHAVSLHIVGFAQQRLAYASVDLDLPGLMERFDAEVDPAVFPRMVAHKEYHEAVEHGHVDHPDEFAFVLDLILDGLERAAAG